jgi:hypothetical protein
MRYSKPFFPTIRIFLRIWIGLNKVSYLEFIKAISLIRENLAPTSFDSMSSLRNLAKVLLILWVRLF